MIFSLNCRFQNTGLCDGHNAAYPYAIQTVFLAPGHMLNNLLDNMAVRSPEDGPILAVVHPPLPLLYPQNSSCCLNRLCLPSLFALAYTVLCAWSTPSLISTHLKELLLTRQLQCRLLQDTLLDGNPFGYLAARVTWSSENLPVISM